MKLSIKSSNSLVLGLFTIFCFISCQAGQPKVQKQSVVKQADSTKAPASTIDKIVVYYFHGNARCPTCFKLESFAKSEIESNFADAIKKGTLEWKAVNVETAGNEHFDKDYKLYTKSVIVSTIQDGKELSWKNLDKIWQLVYDENNYREYIKKEVAACLAGKCL
jgi:hypothetical protein